MSQPRLRRALALATAFAATAATAGIAFGQAAAPSGHYGGGAIAVPVKESTVAKDMILSVRAGSDGRIGVDGQIYARCGLGTISGDGRIGSEGRFTLRGWDGGTFLVTATVNMEGGKQMCAGPVEVTLGERTEAVRLVVKTPYGNCLANYKPAAKGR